MSKKWIFLTCVLSLGSIEISQAHPLDSRDIVYIDGVPCNSACQSYMAWSRQILSASGHQAPTQLRQRPASETAHRATTAGRQVREARQAVPLPPVRLATLQPADNAAGKPDGSPVPSPEQKSHDDAVVASRPESVPPGDVGKATPPPPDNDNNPAPDQKAGSGDPSDRPETTGSGDTKTAAAAPPFDVAGLEPSAGAAVDANSRTIRQQVIADTVIAEHVMTLRDAEKGASGSPGTGDQMDVVVITRPEINAISDLAGKDIAIEDRYSASRDKVRTAIAAAGAIGIQLSAAQTKAIDRLLRGEVPAAVLTLLYPETGFPQFAGFKIFRIPLGPGSPTARL